jgi:hypothetical protein
MGVPMFIGMNVLVLLNKRLLNSLKLVDKCENTYDYLNAFDSWLKSQINTNKNFARFFYPFVFLSIITGFWMKKSGSQRIGDHTVQKLLLTYPDLQLVGGVPVVGVLGALLIVGILALLAGRIYEWDLKIIYGRLFKKFDELLADIKELRA